MPLAQELTWKMLQAVQSEPINSTQAQALNFVVSALMVDRGRRGASPLDYPDIETVASAVALLAERDRVELSPFVQSWDPGVGAVERSLTGQQSAATRIVRQLDRDSYQADSFAQELSSYIRVEVGLAASGSVYRTLADAMLGNLRYMLPTPPPSAVSYLDPLINLGRRRGGVTMASLNYDLTIETAATAADVAVSTGVQTWQAAAHVDFTDDAIRLIKLHGSLNWTRGTATFASRIEPDGAPSPTGIDSSTLILREPNTNEVPFLIFGRREKLRPHGPFLDLRAEFARRLSQARCLVVTGYSFADEHVNELITRWVNADPNRFIVVVDPRFTSHVRDNFRYKMVKGLRRDDVRNPSNRRAVASRLLVIRQQASVGLADICASSIDDLAERCREPLD